MHDPKRISTYCSSQSEIDDIRAHSWIQFYGVDMLPNLKKEQLRAM
jgi:hypothetical protein